MLLRIVLACSCVMQAMGAFGQDYLIKAGGVHVRAGNYQIVLNPGASPSERQAAAELKSYLQQAGVDVPIADGIPADGTPMIVLGCGAVSRQLGVDPKPDQLGEQGYVMRTVAPHIVIAGTPAAGTLYGVYDFLEQYAGVRWYAPDVTDVPKLTEPALPQVDVVVKPAFSWRHTSYAWPGKDDAFLAHVRDNSGNGGADRVLGVQHAHDRRCHSYHAFISVGEFFKDHPEYFSEIGGVRRDFETQLCLTNPDVLEIVAERMLKRMADMPECRQHNFSQEDYYNYCQCAKCTEMNRKYGTLGGTQFWFVNQLAERTAKVYPAKLIGTLAYIYTEEPPKDMVIHPNVAVWLCHMFPSCDSHPISTCKYNADYKRRAEAWSMLCRHLYIWHYVVDFAHYYNPFPNFGAMAADMRFYRDIGVEGIYLQGMGESGGGGEFSLLRPYYGMKLLWNPDQDADALMKDFLKGYYGAAADPINQYVKMLQAKVDDEDIHMHLYTNPAQGYLTNDVMDAAVKLFDQAEEAVKDNPELLERVKVARMPLTYAQVFPRGGYEIKGGVMKFKETPPDLAELQGMVDRMQAHGFKTLREMDGGEPESVIMLGLLLMQELPAPSVENSRIKVECAPLFGGRVLRIIDKASGQCVTGCNITRNLYFPFCGGEESRLDGIFRPTGLFEQYDVTAKDENSVTMSAKVSGFELKRTVTVAADAPEVTITAELTNVTDKPREAKIRSHTNLNLGDLSKTTIAFINRKGESVARRMPGVIDGMREGEHYLDQDVPKAAWTFSGSKNVKLTQSFDDAQVNFAWAYAYPDYLEDLEVEVWAKPVMVAPGQSVRFATTMKIE